MALYGRNGAGKTHFAGSSELKTIVIDCDEKGSETLGNRPNVDVYALERWTDLDGIYWYLRTADHPYEVAVIDTISMLATVAMKWVMGEAKSRDPMIDPLIPEQRQWNKVTQALDNVIINWRNLPMHVIFLAQERVFTTDNEDGSGTIVEVAPGLSPSALRTLMSTVGTIGRIYTEEIEVQQGTEMKRAIVRRMLLGPHPRYAAKTRIAGVPRILTSPTLAKLLAIRDAKGETAAPTEAPQAQEGAAA